MGNVLFSAARASYLSLNLLGRDRLKRMVEGDLVNAIKVLSETGFGVGSSVGDGGAGIDVLIERERSKLAEFIRTSAPDNAIKQYFLLPYDFRNAETLVKAKFLKIATTTNSFGTIDEKTLKDRIFADEYKGLPANMAIALSAADRLFAEGNADGYKINVLFVKALYEDLFALKTDKRLKDMLAEKADMANVGIALRARNYERAKNQFVKRGYLSENDLRTLCESDLAELPEKFGFSRYKEEIVAAVNGLEKDKSLKEFERISDGYAAKMMNKERYSSEGATPFIRYCVYKFADVQNAGIILTGLSAGLTREEITSRIREHYEG